MGAPVGFPSKTPEGMHRARLVYGDGHSVPVFVEAPIPAVLKHWDGKPFAFTHLDMARAIAFYREAPELDDA